MKPIIFLFILINSFNLFFSEKLNYQLVIEYLYSDIKEIYDLELFSRPKTNELDFGDDIFYSGKIEKIENFPINKLINFTREEEKKKILKKDISPKEETTLDELKKVNEEYIKEEKEETIKDTQKQRYPGYDFDLFDSFFFDEPIIRMIFDNDYNQYNKFIKRKYKPIQKEQKFKAQENQTYYQKPS